jgi:sialate O-acetylesterase
MGELPKIIKHAVFLALVLAGNVNCALLAAQSNALMTQAAEARKPFLHPLFANNMVWQRDIAAPIWGWTTPGAKVTVVMHGKSATATADAAGKWLVKLGPLKAGGPYTLTVKGPQAVELTNVLVGDVWLCSGQSNMEMGINMVNNATQEIATATDGNIRLLLIRRNIQVTPQATVDAAWEVCSPQTVVKNGWGGFSAAAYFFGRQLRRDIHVPIGLIESSFGGTQAQAWTSSEALRKALPEFNSQLNRLDIIAQHAADPHYSGQFESIVADWWREVDGLTPGRDLSPYVQADYNDAAWKTMALPIHLRDTVEKIDGVLWYRKEVQIPETWTGKDLQLHLGGIDDVDVTYFNGLKVGTTTGWKNARNYPVPGAQVKAGRCVIALRLTTDLVGWGGICGQAADMKLINPTDAEHPIPLAGDWRYFVAADFEKNPIPTLNESDPYHPAVLFNGMIAPLLPFAIKGAIWYQGESNAGHAQQYRTLLPTMISDWRTRFGAGDFPFYIVSLANFGAVEPQPADSAWAELREAQFLTSRQVPHSGLAVTVDIGDANDIHPKNKQEVGRRLALIAEALTYGKKQLEYSGPVNRGMTVKGEKVLLGFDHLGGGLVVKGDKLKGFAIAGAEKHFVWADADITGNSVVVSSPLVAHPVAVRYNWSDNPSGNLFNQAGLPAVPFRTDVP